MNQWQFKYLSTGVANYYYALIGPMVGSYSRIQSTITLDASSFITFPYFKIRATCLSTQRQKEFFPNIPVYSDYSRKVSGLYIYVKLFDNHKGESPTYTEDTSTGLINIGESDYNQSAYYMEVIEVKVPDFFSYNEVGLIWSGYSYLNNIQNPIVTVKEMGTSGTPHADDNSIKYKQFDYEQ